MQATNYVSGQDWYIEQRKPHGGFCFIHANSMMAVWHALVDGSIQLRDLRTWLACHEMKARRCRLEPGRTPRYDLDELASLTATDAVEHARASLRRLSRSGLLSFSALAIETTPAACQNDRGRPVPVPRPVLRLLCKERGRVFIATTLGHLLRCLYYKNGVCRSGGWCKSSWVAETFDVAVRTVKEARKRLVSLGLLRLLNADQLRLNRFGRPLVWLLDWGRRSAPRKPQSTAESAPPSKHKKLSYQRVDHQKPDRHYPSDSDGVCKQTKNPDIDHITEYDLDDSWRLAALFKQARLRGWVKKTESDLLNFYAAAHHATRVGISNQCGLFAYIVRRAYWRVLSIEDEERGRLQLWELRGSKSQR